MKTTSLSYRLLAIILCFVLCCAYLPETAVAAGLDAPYDITANDGTTITELSVLEDTSVLDVFSREAELMNYGIEIKIVNFMPQFGARGEYVSPFHMKATGTNGITSFAMEKPEFNSEADTVLNGIYKIAVQDASDPTAPVLFSPQKKIMGA